MLKVGKMIKILQEQAYVNSMNFYLNYKVPKFQEIVQIVLMLLGNEKPQINLARSNALDCRKCLKRDFIEKLMVDL